MLLRSPSRDLRVGGDGGATGWIFGLGLLGKLSPSLSYGRSKVLSLITLKDYSKWLI